jgi:hypothetical protein
MNLPGLDLASSFPVSALFGMADADKRAFLKEQSSIAYLLVIDKFRIRVPGFDSMGSHEQVRARMQTAAAEDEELLRYCALFDDMRNVQLLMEANARVPVDVVERIADFISRM